MSNILDNMEQVDDAVEPTVAEANEECKLRIIAVSTGTDKNDFPYVMPRFEIVGNDFAKDFTYFLSIPTKELANQDKKKFEKAKWKMKEFLSAFGIDSSRPGDPEDDWPGEEGWAILGVQETDEYGKQNFVKKFVAGR